jgi:hypothetical protein
MTPSWQALRFPATGINPPGAARTPDRDTTYGWLTFSASAVNTVAVVVQLPHGLWQSKTQPTVISPHIHWMKSTSAPGNAVWRLQYRWVKIGQVMDADWTTPAVATVATGTPDTNTANKHLISSFGGISTPHSSIRDADMLVMTLSRLGNDKADTYGAEAILLEFDIHVPLQSFAADDLYGTDLVVSGG